MPELRDDRMLGAANHMRSHHGPDHPRHKMWVELATLLERLSDLAPYWHEPYAAPFVPIIEAGVQVATEYNAAALRAVADPPRAEGWAEPTSDWRTAARQDFEVAPPGEAIPPPERVATWQVAGTLDSPNPVKGYYGPAIRLLFMDDGTVRWEVDD